MSGPSQIGKTAHPQTVVRRSRKRPASGFDAALDRLVNEQRPKGPEGSAQSVSLSKHARARLQSRGLQLDHAERDRLQNAVDELAKRGAREALVLTTRHAFVVGVPKRTVITAMGRSEALGQVFTGIDATFVTDE